MENHIIFDLNILKISILGNSSSQDFNGNLTNARIEEDWESILPDVPTSPMPDPRDDHLPEFQNGHVIYWKRVLYNKLVSMRKNKYLFIQGKL